MEREFDILVAGAGSAGFCAAVQAGRLGKKVVLVERCGMPGGILTVGGNNDIAQFFAHQKQVISGIGWEYVKRLEAMGGAQVPDMFVKDKPHWYYGVHVNIPLAAALMDEMLLEAGVTVCYEQVVAAAETAGCASDRKIDRVLITSKNGLIPVRAKTYIDCTGDGDLSVFAGAQVMEGEYREDGTLSLQPGTVRYYIAPKSDADTERADRAMKEALEDGSLLPTDTMRRTYSGIVAPRGNNINHVSGYNGADSEEKTAADIEGRRMVARIIAAARRGGVMPDIEAMATETAMRETRRIVCDGCVTAEDYVAARDYPDAVCTSFYPIDLHRDGMGGIQQVFLTDGQIPRIPLSAMTVKGLSNLFVAGRCACGDRLANSAYRVKASCMAMGQACGAAAALAVDDNGGRTRGISVEKLKSVLAENGALVPGVNI